MFYVVTLIILLVFIPFSQLTSLLVFPNDPKKGGREARPSGRFDFIALLMQLFVDVVNNIFSTLTLLTQCATAFGYGILCILSVLAAV